MNPWVVGGFIVVAVGSLAALAWLARRPVEPPMERPGSDDQWRSFPVVHNPALNPQRAADAAEEGRHV